MGVKPIENVDEEERSVDKEFETGEQPDASSGQCYQNPDKWVKGPPNIAKIIENGDKLGVQYQEDDFAGRDVAFPVWVDYDQVHPKVIEFEE